MTTAVGAFGAEAVTLGQAAEIAGIFQTEWMRELSRRRIPLHDAQEEFAEVKKHGCSPPRLIEKDSLGGDTGRAGERSHNFHPDA